MCGSARLLFYPLWFLSLSLFLSFWPDPTRASLGVETEGSFFLPLFRPERFFKEHLFRYFPYDKTQTSQGFQRLDDKYQVSFWSFIMRPSVWIREYYWIWSRLDPDGGMMLLCCERSALSLFRGYLDGRQWVLSHHDRENIPANKPLLTQIWARESPSKNKFTLPMSLFHKSNLST